MQSENLYQTNIVLNNKLLSLDNKVNTWLDEN